MSVHVADDGPVRTITIDRARQFNALDAEHFRALAVATGEAMAAPAVRIVVLAAEGRMFCVGADVGVFAAALADGSMRRLVDGLLPLFQETVLRLAEGTKPTIAAVQGPAAGAGLDLALACDLRVLGDKATLATAYGRVGLVPDGGAPHHLIRLLGAARAKELLLLPDRVIQPEEAVRWGLALEAVPRDQVLGKAMEVAKRLAAGSATAARLVKGLIAEDGTRTLWDALEAEHAAQRVAIAGPDAAAGIRAAVERRPTAFPTAAGAPPGGGTPA